MLKVVIKTGFTQEHIMLYTVKFSDLMLAPIPNLFITVMLLVHIAMVVAVVHLVALQSILVLALIRVFKVLKLVLLVRIFEVAVVAL